MGKKQLSRKEKIKEYNGAILTLEHFVRESIQNEVPVGRPLTKAFLREFTRFSDNP